MQSILSVYKYLFIYLNSIIIIFNFSLSHTISLDLNNLVLFISVREICQRRKFQGKFTYLAFLDLKKAYDSVPIFNILTKLYHYGVRGKCFDFSL